MRVSKAVGRDLMPAVLKGSLNAGFLSENANSMLHGPLAEMPQRSARQQPHLTRLQAAHNQVQHLSTGSGGPKGLRLASLL